MTFLSSKGPVTPSLFLRVLGKEGDNDYLQGETVVTEVAVLKLGGDEVIPPFSLFTFTSSHQLFPTSHVQVGDEASSLGAQFALLSPALQRKVTALHSQGEEEGRDRLANIFQTNCIQGKAPHSTLY